MRKLYLLNSSAFVIITQDHASTLPFFQWHICFGIVFIMDVNQTTYLSRLKAEADM